MSDGFTHDVFISYSKKDKAVVFPLAERLRDDGLRVWLDRWELKPGELIESRLVEGVMNSRKLLFCMSANLSDWAQFESGIFRHQDPLGKGVRRIIPLRLDESPVHYSMQSFHHIDWTAGGTECEYQRLVTACRMPPSPQFDEELDFPITAASRILDGASLSQPAADLPQETSATPEPCNDDEEDKIFKQLAEELKKLRRKRFTFLIVGRAGVGKSSTINSLLGKRVCETSAYDVATAGIRRLKGKVDIGDAAVLGGIPFFVYDTPGLGASNASRGSRAEAEDRKYLVRVKKEVEELDCMLFVTPIDDTRVSNDEMRTIALISEVFGKQVWKRSVVVFTFADKVTAEEFPDALVQRTRRVREWIGKHSTAGIASTIPFVAAANSKVSDGPIPKFLPNGKSWLLNLFTQILLRVSNEAAVPFLIGMRHLLKATVRKKQNKKKQERGSLDDDSDAPEEVSEEDWRAVGEKIDEISGWKRLGNLVRNAWSTIIRVWSK